MSKNISVYFNGTDESTRVRDVGIIPLATLLHLLTEEDDNNSSFCINGCGESKDIRDLGIIFAFHLEKQVTNLVKQIEDKMKNNSDKVIINVYGFSRGGVAAFLLCKKLKHISSERLEINVVTFDPVPGNSILAVYGDIALRNHCTLSAEIADLTACKNISNVLALYANEPTPDFACHAPILPALPTTCKPVIDVTPGCHKAAVLFSKLHDSIFPENTESEIVLRRVVEFMQDCGTKFNLNRFKIVSDLMDEYKKGDSQRLLRIYDDSARVASFHDKDVKRSMHLHNTIFTTKQSKLFLNYHHQQLAKLTNPSDKDCKLSVVNSNTPVIPAASSTKVQYVKLALAIAMFMILYHKYIKPITAQSNRDSGPRF